MIIPPGLYPRRKPCQGPSRYAIYTELKLVRFEVIQVLLNVTLKNLIYYYYYIVLSGHWYLKRITTAKIGQDQRIDILLLFLALPKNLQVWRAISEESLEMLKQIFDLVTRIYHGAFANLVFGLTLIRG